MPMRFRRFQFTIRGLIVLIAICGVFFAVLRTPLGFLAVYVFGFLAVYVGAILPGFLIGRARGGSGIIAGALSASALLVVGWIWHVAPQPPWRVETIAGVFALTTLVGGFTFVFSLLVSGALYLVVEVIGILLHPEQQVRSSDEIWWLPPDDGRADVAAEWVDSKLPDRSAGAHWDRPGRGAGP
jgi:hypothetical protein